MFANKNLDAKSNKTINFLYKKFFFYNFFSGNLIFIISFFK